MRFPHSPTSQAGFTLLEVLLAIGVSLSIGAVALTEIKRDNESKQARAVGQQMATVGKAMNTYIALQYTNLINLTNVDGVGGPDDPGPRHCTPNATTVNGNPAAICTITTDTLIRSGLLPTSFSGRNAYGADYHMYVRVLGSAPNWIVEGLTVTSSPYTTGAGNRYDLLGQAMQEAGADSAMTRTLANTIEGLNGTWRDNAWPSVTHAGVTYPGVNQLGLLGYRAGYGSSGYAAYLRLDGATPMTGNLDMDEHDILNVKLLEGGQARLQTAGATLSLNAANETDPDRTDFITGVGTVALRNANGVAIQQLDGTPGNFSAGDTTVEGNLASNGDISAVGNLQAHDITAQGNMGVAGTLNVGGAAQVASLSTSGNGNIVAGGTGTVQGYNVTASNQLRAGGSGTTGGVVTTGDTGWYNETYGGGWFMNDTTWIRSRNNKSIYTGGSAQIDQNVTVGGDAVVGNAVNLRGTTAAGAVTTVTQGTACAGSDVGTLRRSTAGIAVQCVNSVWRNLGVDSTTTASSGTVASPGVGGATVFATATCPTNSRIVGGGYVLMAFSPLGGGYDGNAPSQSYPNGNAWTIALDQRTGNSSFQARAVCAY